MQKNNSNLNQNTGGITMKFYSVSLALLATSCLLISSCGGGNPSSEKKANQKETKEEKLSPDQIGEAVSAIYLQALKEVNNLISERPAASELEPKLIDAKETYVQKLIAYGKLRETMDDAGKSKTDLAIRLGLSSAYKDNTYNNYSQAIMDYSSDKALYDLLVSFNIITQYANFDLLKKQEPEEAQRLGIR